MKDIIDSVTTDVPWGLVERFATMGRWKPEDVTVAADLLVETLAAAGVPATVHRPKLYLSIPFTGSVSSAAGEADAKPPSYAVPTEGLTAPLIYVPATVSTSINTLFEKAYGSEGDVAGKIVVSEGFSFPGKVLEMERKGAVGVIAVNPGIDRHWGICTSIWGTPDLDDLPRKPRIPVVAVNKPDGEALIALAAEGGDATLRCHLEEGWYESPVPEVVIPGQEDDFVLLHGHYDSWDVGVGDNATGDATLLEVARVLWTHRDRLKRGVRIAWWPGHSTGRYAGSTWYADAHAILLDEHCVAQVNCDSPGCRWATIFKDVSWMSETEAYCQQIIKSVTGLDSQGERPHRAGDYAFNNIGLSSFFMLSSTMPDELRAEKGYYVVGGCGGNIAWHTENDTLEIADRDILERDIKVYLAAVLGVANAEVLPFDWRATMAEFRTTVARYQAAAGERFDLSPVVAEIDALDHALAAFYAADAPAAEKNRKIKALARVLVPINFTTQPRFRHDPALPVPPLPTLALCEDLDGYGPDSIGFALTGLLRGRNRVVAALRAARALL